MFLTDNLQLNEKDGKRTIISVRDGYQEYTGEEIGQEPADKVFRVYRHPDEVKRISKLLPNLPVTDEHISVGGKIKNQVGKINDSNIITVNNEKSATIGAKNIIDLNKNFSTIEKNQVSLGYSLDLIKHNVFDYEQTNIVPHHLAIVKDGRCGLTCNFKDNKGVKMTETEMNKKISDIETEHKSKIEDMQEKMDEMQEKYDVMAEKQDNENSEKVKQETKKEAITDYKASDGFKKVIASEAKKRLLLIDKARHFLSKDYNYDEKTNCEISKDAVLAENPSTEFEDSEIPTAFKLLKVKGKLSIKDKEITNKWDTFNKEKI